MTPAAAELGAFGAALTPRALPPAVLERAKIHLLDTLGAGIAGMRSPEAEICLETVTTTGGAPLWGTSASVAPATAALVNGIAAHALELDDTDGCDHSGAVVVPSALAALSVSPERCSGAELLTAVVLGYEIARRVLDASGGYDAFNAKGWHSTGVCGTFGAAAAAAKVLRLDAGSWAHAIGLAGSFTGGLWAFLRDGSMAKRLHAGRAAEAGLTAAMLAGGGFTGPLELFEADWGGYFTTYAGQDGDPAALAAELGRSWRIEQSSIKPYASCRGTHAAIDAILGLGLPAVEIESVRVRLSRFLYDMCGGTDPVSLVDAQMSLPFTVAAAAIHGRLGPAQLDEAGRADPSVRLLMSRIVPAVDDRLHGSAPPILEVRTRDGTTQMVHAGEPLGSLANPMTTESVTAKFAELAGTALSPRRAGKLRDTVSRLDEMSDAAVLLECLTG